MGRLLKKNSKLLYIKYCTYNQTYTNNKTYNNIRYRIKPSVKM